MIRLITVLIVIFGATFITAQIVLKILNPEHAKVALSWPKQFDLGYRLPNDTYPLRYDLELTTYIHLEDEEPEEGETIAQKFRFDGKVTIEVSIRNATDMITVHSRGLSITSSSLVEKETEDTVDYEIETQTEFDFLTFKTEEMLVEGKVYILEISFFGELGRFSGFYRSSYTDEDGNERWLATTQFQPTSARNAFPCFDEPGIRAPIKLSIIHVKNYFAISNMPKDATISQPNDMVKTTFLLTPSMQTYLLAFVVSDFTFVEIHGTVPQRVFARKDVIDRGEADFAVRAGVNILHWLEDHLNFKYSKNNPKMDQIGIPDFVAGAMENWGLVTYQEGILYYNEKSNRYFTKYYCAGTVGHEYAHQYFGNLVSPQWWSYIWLNEGFATLYAAKSAEGPFPELSNVDNYQLSAFAYAMAVEELGLTRPMTLYVEAPTDVYSLFDAIAYSKASAVLRMISFVMTEDVWKQGLHYYLTEMENKAASPDDLARNLQKAVDESDVHIGETVQDIIDSWSLNAGLPILHVSLDTEINELQFTQERFLISKDIQVRFPNEKDEWFIPISLTSATQPKLNSSVPQFWIKSKSGSKRTSAETNWGIEDWILVNVGATGYYRVNYDDELWARLITKLSSGSFEDIPLYSRTQILDDAFSFGRAEMLDYATILKLTRYLSQETHYLPWSIGSQSLAYLDRLLLDSEVESYFNVFIRDLSENLYQSVGVKDRGNLDTYGDKVARNWAVYWACKAGVPSCITEARNRLNSSYYDPNESIELELEGTLQCAALRQVSDDEFDLVWSRMQVTKDANERLNLINALGCTVKSNQQVIYLNSTIADGTAAPNYTPSERYNILSAVYKTNRLGLINSINFISENYDQVKKLYSTNAIPFILNGMSFYISSEQSFNRFQDLLSLAQVKGDINSEESQAIKGLAELNIEWIKNNEEEVFTYLRSLYSGSVSVTILSTSLLVFGIIFNRIMA